MVTSHEGSSKTHGCLECKSSKADIAAAMNLGSAAPAHRAREVVAAAMLQEGLTISQALLSFAHTGTISASIP